jgi:hypothetical protein
VHRRRHAADVLGSSATVCLSVGPLYAGDVDGKPAGTNASTHEHIWFLATIERSNFLQPLWLGSFNSSKRKKNRAFNFLSQLFFVTEVFTGSTEKYVGLAGNYNY